MKKYLSIIILLIIASSINITNAQDKNLYDFKVKDINNQDFDFSTLKGKKVLIVNVASKCGFTPQYAQLEELYKKYKDQGFIIIGFPSNDFKGQEPGTNEEIKEFCTLNYGVTFPIMSKISVIGSNKASIYKWLTEKSENGKFDAEVQWNFQKFLIGRNGNIVNFAPSKESPLSPKIINWIEKDKES